MIRRHVQKSQASIPTGQARGATPPNRRGMPLRLVVSAQTQGEGQGDGVEVDGQENMQGRCFRF